MSLLPLSKFCNIFKIVSDDEEEIIEDFDSFIEDEFPLIDKYSYRDFKRAFKSNIKDEMEFKTAVEELKVLNIKDYETSSDEKCKFTFDYDTISGVYTHFDSITNSIKVIEKIQENNATITRKWHHGSQYGRKKVRIKKYRY